MSAIPSTMKSIILREQGGPDKLNYEDVPVPKVTENSVLIKNHFTGINFIDTYQRSGLYKVDLPYILGREGSGEVVEVGTGVSDLKLGDRVVYLAGSSYAEYTNASVATVSKLPQDVSSEEAVALGLQGITAWTMIRDGYRVNKGDVVLVHAAAGGVGLLLLQMLRHLGATIIGTVSTEEKGKLAIENGADYIINYSKEDVASRVEEITGGLGCHAVLDGVGKDTWEASLKATRNLGTLISYGNSSGVVPPISILSLAPKNIKLMRPQLYAYINTQESFRKWWGEILELLSKKVIKLNVYKHYKLEEAAEAHIDIESRKTTGKLLVKF